MLKAIVILTAITFIPALELRASIPWGVFLMKGQLSWLTVALICTVANIVLGWLVFLVLGPVFTFIRRWEWFARHVWPILERTQHKLNPYVEKYGEMGVAVFIGVPLPGTGVYTGAFGAYLLGLDRRKFAAANVLGVLIAAVAVTVLCLLILHGKVAMDSWIARVFIKTVKG